MLICLLMENIQHCCYSSQEWPSLQRCKILNGIKKNQCQLETYCTVQKNQKHANISVDVSMITKYEWSSQEDTMEDAAAIQKHLCTSEVAKQHLDVPQRYWQHFLWPGKKRRKMGRHNIKTSSQRPSCFGAALVPQGLYSLLSYAEK